MDALWISFIVYTVIIVYATYRFAWALLTDERSESDYDKPPLFLLAFFLPPKNAQGFWTYFMGLWFMLLWLILPLCGVLFLLVKYFCF